MQGMMQRLRRMCLHGPAWPARLSSLYATHATEATHQPKPDSQPPVGGYTPITTALWLERLQHGATGGAMTDSTASKTVVYKFSTDKIMRELYRNPWDYVRIGKIMEDLDSLAGSIAFQHCFTPGQPPPLLVTASVDEITLTHPISTDQDVTMQGSVAWTGSSSLDILMTITQPQHTQPSLTSLFSFVNLDSKTGKAAPVRPITPTTPDQQALFQARQHVADARKRARHTAAAHGAHVQGDTPEAIAFMRPLVSKHRQLRELPALVAAGGAVVLEDTRLTNTFIAMPQQRNTHGRIFGGWLMGLAYELAFATTYTFSGQRPVFLKCDEIVFKKPVDVGDLLRFHSTVLHAVRLPDKKGLVCVEVEAIVATPAREEPAVAVTNSFMFVFQVSDHPTAGPVKQVLPSNDEEARKAWDCHQALLDAGYLPPGDK